MDFEHVIDMREEDRHTQSMFCRCRPSRIKNTVLHNSLTAAPTLASMGIKKGESNAD